MLFSFRIKQWTSPKYHKRESRESSTTRNRYVLGCPPEKSKSGFFFHILTVHGKDILKYCILSLVLEQVSRGSKSSHHSLRMTGMIYTSFNNNLHCDHQQHIVPADVGVPLTSTSGPSERDQVTVEEDEFLNRKQ